MTTRDQVRRAVGPIADDDARRSAAEPAPGLPERLLAARERKGVDLYRAERDTKIRARYLAALERGDYRELPGAVYTKGFLRNYALYLGLDPDEVLLQWRRERGDAARAAGGHRRPAADRRAAPGPDLLAGPRRLRAADGRRRSPSPATSASSSCASPSRRRIAVTDAGHGRHRRRRGRRPTYILRGHVRSPGGAVTITTPGRRPVQRQRRRRPATGAARSSCAAVENQFEVRPPTRRPARRPRRRSSAVHHRAVPGHRGADPDGRPAGRGRDVRERGHPGPGHARPTPSRSSSARPTSGPAEPASRAGDGHPGAAGRAGAAHGQGRRGRHVQHARSS